MIGEECKFLHPAMCRKYMENPERSCRAQCKGYHPEFCKYSRAAWECYNDGCFRIHRRAQRASKPRLRPRNQVQLPELQVNNKLWSPHKIWLATPPNLVNTPHPQHTTATHPAPSPTHYHTPTAMQYLTTHQTTVPLYPNPHHSLLFLIQPANLQPLLNPFSLLKHPKTSALVPQIHYHTFPHIVIAPQSHNPHLNTQDEYQRTTQRGTTANDHTIFFMGSDAQCTTTIEQHDGGDESKSSFLGQTNLYSIISCNIQGLNTKKQKHKVQLLISQLITFIK